MPFFDKAKVMKIILKPIGTWQQNERSVWLFELIFTFILKKTKMFCLLRKINDFCSPNLNSERYGTYMSDNRKNVDKGA